MFAETADAVVVGTGAVGAAATYQLARRGVAVLGIDRFQPPHDRGSSHGETRVTRLATGEGEEYVPFVRRSHEIWRALESESGETLLRTCGFLAIDGSGGEALRHGRAGFFNTTVNIARRAHIDHEVLSAGEATRRYPGLALAGDERIFFEPGAGIVHPERAIAAQIGAARALGARFAFDRRVLGITPRANHVEIATDGGMIEAGTVIVAAGAWTPQLVEEPGLRLLRQTLHWFEPAASHFELARFPTFLWLHGPRPEDSFYGFPTMHAGAAMKIATEQFADAIARPEDLDRTVPPIESAALYAQHVAGRLRGLGRRAVKAAACLYTHASDGRFVIDHVLNSRRVIVASACSGHGFKHSAAVGERLASHVVDDVPLDSVFRRRSPVPAHAS